MTALYLPSFFRRLLIFLFFITTALRAAVLTPAYTIGSEVPVTAATYTATGNSLGSVTLFFSPSPSQVLTVVNNTGVSAISGTFTGLAEGAKLSAAYGGNTFTFHISYVGGDGNDITLMRVGATAQMPNGGGYTWTTLAGSLGGVGSQGRTGAQASFYYPSSTAVDSAGNVYVADTFNHTIRKVTSAGVVSTLAGSAGETGSTDGTGSAARFNNPTGVAVDSAGNVYVADKFNHTVRKVTAAGVVTTLAGSAGVKGSLDGTGGTARFFCPSGVAVDSAGNVYLADLGNSTIRKVTAAGGVSTLAGSAGVIGSTDGTGGAASFNIPSGVAVDSAGSVYVADSGNSTIRTVTAAGVVSTLAGSADATGSTDGTGSAANFNNPSGLAVDSAGNIYVADLGNSTIRKVTAAGVVSTLAGSAAVTGSTDGIGSVASFNNPGGLAVDSAGNVYVADYINSTIRKVTAAGVVSTLAGSAGVIGSTDGTGSAASFNNPTGVAVDGAGNVYLADQFNHTIRKVTAAGVVTTLAGSPGVIGSADGTGSAAEFYYPSSVAVDSAGNVYVADQFNHTIRKVTPAGGVSTLAGSAGVFGSTDGTGSAASFNSPSGVAVDSAGNVYVADGDNSTIRKVTAAGVVSTLAGSAGVTGGTDGTGSAASFFYPNGIAVDSAGNVYVADGDNSTVRKVTAAGVVSTLAGSAGVTGSTDGTGSAARLNNPTGLAVDSAGNVYVADQFNHTIRKVTAAGVVSTIGGVAGRFGHAIGYESAAGFYYPSGISVSSSGVIYVTDSNHRVAQGQQLSGFQPVLTLGSISALGATTATLNGTVNPNGFATTAQFEYGSTTSYGTTAAVTLSAIDGTTAQNVSASLTGLTLGSVYYYRLSAVNVDGVQTTSGGTFTTILGTNANLSALALSSGALSPAFASGTVNYTASVGSAVSSINVTPTLADANGSVEARSNGGTYASVISGSASGAMALNAGSNTVDVRVTAQDGVTQKIYTLTVARGGAASPTVDSPEAESISATSASLGGNVIADGGAEITERGVVYSVTASNGNPLIGGAGVTKMTASGTTGLFTAAVTGLVQGTVYSYRAYATNSQGTSYTSPATLTTLTFHQSWRQAYFGSSLNSGRAADDADPDNDGLPNLMERALNLPPNAASRVSEKVRTTGGNMEYTYTRGTAAHHGGTTFQVEWSDDLTTWSSAGVDESLLSDDGTHQQVKATMPAGSSSRRFVRLRVQ